MEFLVLSACGLVASQYMRLKTKSHKSNKKSIDSIQISSNESSEEKNADKYVTNEKDSDGQLTRSSPASIPLGVRTLKKNDIGDVSYDDARYTEQYSHPQDPNPSVTSKPWMRMVNAPYKPKEEVVSEIPGPQDVLGRNMNARVKQIESDFAGSTVPVTSEKQYDRPVEQISTGNGSAVGFHIGAGRRYHKFILNDQPTIESEGGPRGAFAGASKSNVKGDYRTVTQRSSLNHESVGPPIAVGVPQSSAPVPSFEITPSHLETYKLDDHMAKAAKAPVEASSSTDVVSFKTAHDENINLLKTSLVTGGDRFATGASGYRDAQIHVPLNNDPVATYDQRIVPNFKLAKASDYQDQLVTARQMMIPEMSQNVSALRKDRKPPVSSSTTHKSSSLIIDTKETKSGAAARGFTELPVKVDTDAFLAPTDRSVVVAEKTAQAATGASVAHMVGSSNSTPSSSSLFRTTQSMSELVGTPFIRGSGGRHASDLEPIHEATDTHLSEVDNSSLRKGLNKFASSVAATVTADATSSVSKTRDERSHIFKKSERDPILVAPGLSGTNRVGAANFDVSGVISGRGLDDDGNVNVMRSGKTNYVRSAPSLTKKSSKEYGTTKDRRLGQVLNARLGSSPAMKKLLKNPYSLPAASRLLG